MGHATAAAPCGSRVRAAARRLVVRAGARPQQLETERPALEVLTVDGIRLDDRVTPVPARGEAVLRAPELPAGTRVYLALLAPGSDRAYLRGPGAAGTGAGPLYRAGSAARSLGRTPAAPISSS